MKIAVYGTLMAGHGRSGVLEEYATRVGPCKIRGDLYAVGFGSFPCLVRGDGEVTGELWEVPDENVEALLRVTDSIEGYREHDERGSMYLRRHVQLIAPAGEEAWTYVWNGRGRDLIPIPDGDWAAWRDRCYAERYGVAS